MPSFQDQNKREWQIKLDAPLIRAVRQDCAGLDLMDYGGEAYEKLAGDPCLLVDVLWVLCRDQASKHGGITDVQFGQSLVGDAIDSATEALTKAVLDFFPKRRRELAAAVIRTREELIQARTDRAMAKLNDPTLMERLTAADESSPSKNATDSPDTAESAPPGLRYVS